MEQLKQMLEAYRNGERPMPTYAELAAIAEASQVSSYEMTMRDLIASKAMPAAIAVLNGGGMLTVRGEQLEMVAKYAYDMADMMMKERSK